MYTSLNYFKPTAFYGYGSMVMYPIITLSKANKEDSLIINDIEKIFSDLDKKYITKKNNGIMPYLKDDTILVSTKKDNKTVVELELGNNTIYVGRYDFTYSIGLEVYDPSDGVYKIDL